MMFLRKGARVRTKLERRRRLAARVALYVSLLLIVALALIVYPILQRPVSLGLRQEWSQVDWVQLEPVQLLQQYLRIDTNAIDGNEVEGAEFLASHLEAAGIKVHIERLGSRHANLYALLEGEDPQALILHNHIDVDPVPDPESWYHPPFSGQIELPWIYGRGAFDMKSIAVAQLMAVLDLRHSGQRPRRSVIFLATGSEEAGSDFGTRWILRQHPEWLHDAWAVLTEGGVVEAWSPSEIKYWGTAFAQKRVVDVIVCSPSRARLEEVARDVGENAASLGELRLTEEVQRFLADYAPTRERPLYRDLLGHPQNLVHHPAAFRQLPGYVQALFRNETHVFPIEVVAEGGYRMRISLHLLPREDVAEALRQLVPPWITHGVATTVLEEPAHPGGSPLEHPVFETIVEILRESHSGVASGPYFLPWTATDSRFFRAAGIPSYGFTPFVIVSTDSFGIGGNNERLALPAFVDGVELYRRLVRRLAG